MRKGDKSASQNNARRQEDQKGYTFETGRVYFDPKVESLVRKVLPGDYMMNDKPEHQLVTVLGSCVSACIRDPRTGVGGMNHFMLPSNDSQDNWGGDNLAFRYGNHAMEVLVNDLLRRGSRREELEVKLFGGAHVARSAGKIGEKNIKFVRRFVFEEGLRVAAEDLGGTSPRRIYFNTFTGKVERLIMRRQDDFASINREETNYQRSIAVQAPVADDIELFD